MAGEHSFPPWQCPRRPASRRRRGAVTLAGAERREERGKEGAKPDDGLSLAFGANSGAGDPPPPPPRLASSCSAFKKGGVLVVCRIFGILVRVIVVKFNKEG